MHSDQTIAICTKTKVHGPRMRVVYGHICRQRVSANRNACNLPRPAHPNREVTTPAGPIKLHIICDLTDRRLQQVLVGVRESDAQSHDLKHAALCSVRAANLQAWSYILQNLRV